MYRIMVVEDEMMISEDIQRAIQQYDHEVTGAYSRGEEALIMALKQNPDLIIMDIKLEGELSGIETAKKIRQNRDIPIIFLTAYSDDLTIESSAEAEPYSYLIKPFNENDLNAAIKIAIIKHKAARKIKESQMKFETLFKYNPEPTAYLDSKFRIIDINDRFTDVFGYSEENAKNKLIFDLVVPENKTVESKALGARRNETVQNFRTERRSKSGKIIPVIISSSPVIIDNNFAGTIVTYRDISELAKAEEEKEKLIADLQKALVEIKTLSGLIPICSHCKRVRDDGGYWDQVEHYISKHSDVNFSHGICPDCMRQYYPEMYARINEKSGKDEK
jgi:PAS domain S-box